MTSNPKLGISLMAVTMLIFAIQDGISQYLAREYNVFFIVMVRYWFFAIFVIILNHFDVAKLHNLKMK